jgi:hypothetical protein
VQVRTDELVAAAEQPAKKYQVMVDETAQTHTRLGLTVQALNERTFPNDR